MSNNTTTTFRKLPKYLQDYVVKQEYEKYTAIEHATWRFVMRNAREFFNQHAYHVYLEGLRETGVPISRIPNVDEMDQVLNRFAWGAVCVSGFIPPLIFLDFQARKILPIATDMRSLEHLLYTPAPDIVHEAAGHAPIIADPGYAEYLKRYAEIARKAIFSNEDIKLYEAIRFLSDTKENPDSTNHKIAKAEYRLQECVDSITWDSEASIVARLFWWTAEYGLIGSLEQPKIYGAGLLSSLSESSECLTANVKKIPLSLACTKQSYDITKPQPQLFVARDFNHLINVLAELESTLAFTKGGIAGLRVAHRAKTVTTTVLDSGIEITGILQEVVSIDNTDSLLLHWEGPIQVSFRGKQLDGHDKNRYHLGLTVILGDWEGDHQVPVFSLSDRELMDIGLQAGKMSTLNYRSGVIVKGVLNNIERYYNRALIINWNNCLAVKGETTFVDPSFGQFNLIIGTSVKSVYGGPADVEAFGNHKGIDIASSSPARKSPYTKEELILLSLYQQLRNLRESYEDKKTSRTVVKDSLKTIASKLSNYPKEWLLRLEIIECLEQFFDTDRSNPSPLIKELKKDLLNASEYQSPAIKEFVKRGLKLAAVPDYRN